MTIINSQTRLPTESEREVESLYSEYWGPCFRAAARRPKLHLCPSVFVCLGAPPLPCRAEHQPRQATQRHQQQGRKYDIQAFRTISQFKKNNLFNKVVFFYDFFVIIIVYRKYVILYVVYDSVNNLFLLNERLVFTNQLHLISIYNKETISDDFVTYLW